MGCTSCASGANGQPKGCKNNGTCGTDSCNKLTVFDWLSNMSLPNGERLLVGLKSDLKTEEKTIIKIQKI